MGSDRMGFGGDGDRFHAARHSDSGSDDERERRDVDMAPRRSDVAMHDAGGSDDGDDEQKENRDDADENQRAATWVHSGGDGNQRRVAGRAVASVPARDRYLSDDTDIEEGMGAVRRDAKSSLTEMMRIDPVDLEWRRQLHAGDPIDAQNIFGNWCPAMALRVLDGEVQVRYLNMNDSWQRWVPLDSGQIAQPATKTRNDSAPLRLAQVVEVRKPGSSIWKEGIVVKARPSDLLVRYAGRQQQFDDWMPFTPDTVAAAGDHVRSRAPLSEQRRFSVKPTATNRLRVIQAQNPRFQHYRDALASRGLRINAVEGDGNCLFRSVSHQIYGDDAHHGIVRQLCMDYMESEKEYFEPYVVGDMSAFLRYLQYKRRDGVWGDDPEIQAMCELYDRPAEVYAYDPTNGFRKLRTFHENSSLSRNRPLIRLSYYGGGHYDSLVGAQHAANIIHESPGQWERRHIEISRRINTREGLTTSDEVGSILAQRVADSAAATTASANGDATEMAQLEQILLMSRNEFDAMRSNLDDTLKMAIAESEVSAENAEQRALHVATEESEMAAIQAELLEKARQASEEEQMRKALEASMKETNGHHHHGGISGDFDDNVSAAIQASLADHTASATPATATAYDEEEEMRRILEMSAKEYEATAYGAPASVALDFGFDHGSETHVDEMDEIQRAIQASLRES